MTPRLGKDIWQGLYDFVLVEAPKRLSEARMMEQIKGRLGVELDTANVTISQPYKHILTHQHIFSRFIVIKVNGSFGVSPGSLKFYSRKKIAALPKPALISRFLDDYNFL
jgi:A/G-specific adenine glycosylase